MSSPDEYRNLPPKMKRFALWTFLLFVGATIGTELLRPALGFWVTVLVLAPIMVAVLIPLGHAARRERDELQR